MSLLVLRLRLFQVGYSESEFAEVSAKHLNKVSWNIRDERSLQVQPRHKTNPDDPCILVPGLWSTYDE